MKISAVLNSILGEIKNVDRQVRLFQNEIMTINHDEIISRCTKLADHIETLHKKLKIYEEIIYDNELEAYTNGYDNLFAAVHRLTVIFNQYSPTPNCSQ